MFFELRKIWKNRWIVCIVIFLVFINGLMFYGECKNNREGYTFTDIKEKYNHAENIEDEYKQLEEKIINFHLVEQESDKYITGNIYDEAHLDEEIIKRYAYINGYHEWRESYIQEMQMKMETPFFYHIEYTLKAMSKCIKVYEKLSSVEIKSGFYGGIEKVLSWKPVMLFLEITIVLFSFCSSITEYENHTILLVKATQNGYIAFFKNKLIALIVSVVSIGSIMLATELLIAKYSIGFDNLHVSIQSVYGMRECPLGITVADYMVLHWEWQMLCCVYVCCICFIVLMSIHTKVLSFLGLGVFILCNYVMSESLSDWINSFSIFKLCDPSLYLAKCMYLNFQGNPVRQMYLIPILLVGVCLFLFYAGYTIYRKEFDRQNIKATKGTYIQLWVKNSLFMQENYKLSFIIHAWSIILIGFIFQICFCNTIQMPFDKDSISYRYYSRQLEGKITIAKDQLLNDEDAKYRKLHEDIETYSVSKEIEDRDRSFIIQSLVDQLSKEEGFYRAKEKYKELTNMQEYVYEEGYRYLLDHKGLITVQYFEYLLLLIMIVAGNESLEYETGMIHLIKSSENKEKVMRIKTYMYQFIMIILILVTWTPIVCTVKMKYGFSSLHATANSLPFFDGWNNQIKIYHVFLIQGCLRLITGTISIYLTKYVIEKIHDYIIGMFSSLLAIMIIVIVLQRLIFIQIPW